MEKVIIKNRKGQNIVVITEKAANPKGLVFVMHGLGGVKEQPHIVTFAEAFKEEEYTVVRFDTTNTFGESDGLYEKATVTSYYEDLQDVINWSKKQSWFISPFVLAGHSLGGISIILYAEEHPDEIKGLAPISTVVSGKLSSDVPMYQGKIDKWKSSGWHIEESKSVPGRIKRLPWTHMEDRLKYDVLLKAENLTMPVLLIVGGKDTGTPYEHQKLLYEKLPNRKELHVIKDAPHTFKDISQLEEIKQVFIQWIKKL